MAPPRRKKAGDAAAPIVRKTRSGAEQLHFQTTTKDTREYRTWFRGEHTHYNPTVARMLDVRAAERFVLQGWVPEAPVIHPDTQITAFGSCFAANISNWLSRRHYRVLNKDDSARNAYVVSCGEGMVNSFVIRQQFEWAWENKTFDGALWHGYKAEEYGYDPEVQAETKRIFDSTDFFILTFGLSEVWYDEPTGNVFWRTIPKEAYDPARHKFRVSTVAENRDNLLAIYRLIRKHRPDAKVLFTLSPIPLIATFRDNSCLTSNAVSKAVLRVAIDEVVREVADEGVLSYWPSYELVTDVFRLPYKPDRRHPKGPVLDYIMTLFEHVWCVAPDDAPPPSLTLAWARACAEAELLPPIMCRSILGYRPRRLRKLLEEDKIADDPQIDKALKRLGAAVLEAWKTEPGKAISLDDAGGLRRRERGGGGGIASTRAACRQPPRGLRAWAASRVRKACSRARGSGAASRAAISSGVSFITSKRSKIPGAKPDETVPSIRRRSASTSSPRCEACSSAIGLSTISDRETSQSTAFLNPPGIARTYSGHAITSASAPPTAAAKASTAGGAGGPSRSGEKIGRSP